jgi:16S rRNA (guanine966-N2)-methyltransferase
MRVIAGKFKGLTLKAPKGMKTRPTTDKVREAVFNVLADLVFEANVLDAFAGSGALGIEALSRGAKHVDFFDKDRQAISVIKENLQKARITEFANVKIGQVEKLLLQNTVKYNLVFLDPPYNKGHISVIENILLTKGILSNDVVVVLETNSKNMELFQSDLWECYKTSVYGDTAVVYYGLKSFKSGNA